MTRCVDPAQATPDLVGRVGNENDWTQFFWGLTAPGVSSQGEVWTMTDALRPYQALCAGTPANGSCNGEFTWGVLTGATNSLGASQMLTVGQIQRFQSLGDTRGVN